MKLSISPINREQKEVRLLDTDKGILNNVFHEFQNVPMQILVL